MVPSRLHLFRRAAHAETVDFAISGERADDHRKRILAAAAVNDVGEQKGLALGFLDAADELPAHEWMQFRVFVDGTVYGQQQSPLLQCLEMLMQVGVAARRFGHWIHAIMIGWQPLQRASSAADYRIVLYATGV